MSHPALAQDAGHDEALEVTYIVLDVVGISEISREYSPWLHHAPEHLE